MDVSLMAVVISYFPDDRLALLVSDLSSQADRVLVVDNGSGQNAVLQSFEIMAPRVQVIRLGSNKGIAAALNKGFEQAKARGFAFVLTLDQDSQLPPNYVQQMLEFYYKRKAEGLPVGMVAPDFLDVNAHTRARFSRLGKWGMETITCSGNTGWLDSSFAITSGSIFPVEVFEKVGIFREDFFIDHVDSEYCLRLVRSRYKILINCAVSIEHSIGNRSVHKFLGLTVKPNHHKPVRRYYIARNGVYTAKQYFSTFPSYTWLTFMRLVHEFLSIVLYEQDRAAKLRMFAIGLMHGWLGRMGPAPA